MTKRTQSVIIDDVQSEVEPVISGVPQGTVLGPLLFLSYIINISDGISSSMKLFADDCLLFRKIRNQDDSDQLQEDLDQISQWCEKWQMSLNINKCKLLEIKSKLEENHNVYVINGEIVEKVKHHPYLGVELTNKLKWDQHVNNISAKATKTLNLLRRNLYKCTEKMKKEAYTTLVRPILEYASSSWDPYTEGNISKLERVQNKAARFIKRDYRWNSSVTQIKADLKLQSLQQRRFIARNVQFHKSLRGESAIETNLLNHTTTEHIAHIQSRIDVYKYSFTPRTTRCWNIIDEKVRAVDSKSFREKLASEFENEGIVLTNPRGIYNRPNLGKGNRTKNFVY